MSLLGFCGAAILSRKTLKDVLCGDIRYEPQKREN